MSIAFCLNGCSCSQFWRLKVLIRAAHNFFPLSKSQTLIQSFRTSKCSKRIRKMKPFLSNITSLLIFLACILVTVVGQRSSVCDTDPDVVGYSTIEDMNLDMQDLVANMTDGDNVFRLCPRTIFIVTEPLTPIVNNTIFTCGVNNSVEDECVFDGGSEQVLIEAILENVSFEGLTFQNFNETSIGAFAPTTSVVTFTNCIWTVSMCCSENVFVASVCILNLMFELVTLIQQNFSTISTISMTFEEGMKPAMKVFLQDIVMLVSGCFDIYRHSYKKGRNESYSITFTGF